ncbi:hypothetical protein bcere0002_54750 [Bacillus cereus ATCC 10876]|nr:hypothetical protein bcere0002_54750 [Bacillus cereus ATCC 10876]
MYGVFEKLYKKVRSKTLSIKKRTYFEKGFVFLCLGVVKILKLMGMG